MSAFWEGVLVVAWWEVPRTAGEGTNRLVTNVRGGERVPAAVEGFRF